MLLRRAAARARSFWGPDGEWDWDADPGQIWVLLASRARGACVFEAFSNSPPFWMTASGRASGAVLPFRGNLRREREPDFVAYLVRVLDWFRDEHGFIFRCAAALESCAGGAVWSRGLGAAHRAPGSLNAPAAVAGAACEHSAVRRPARRASLGRGAACASAGPSRRSTSPTRRTGAPGTTRRAATLARRSRAACSSAWRPRSRTRAWRLPASASRPATRRASTPHARRGASSRRVRALRWRRSTRTRCAPARRRSARRRAQPGRIAGRSSRASAGCPLLSRGLLQRCPLPLWDRVMLPGQPAEHPAKAHVGTTAR